MKDFLGNKLYVGDEVIYINCNSSHYELIKDKIVRITDKSVVFSNRNRRNPKKVVKVLYEDDSKDFT